MPAWVKFEIVGDQAGVDAMIKKVDYALSPVGLEVFMLEIVEPWLQMRSKERFRNEGDDVSGKWAPLKPSTNIIRTQLGYGADHPINKRTGIIERYITESRALVRVLPSGAVLTYPGGKAQGELKDKVTTAQIGKPYPNTVPRPVLGVNEADLASILESLGHFIQGLA